MNGKKISLKSLIEQNKEEILNNPTLLDEIEANWENKKSNTIQIKPTEWK